MSDAALSTTELGESGSRVVFCHGLFGQGKNFTAVGKALAADHRVTLVDMPDHGRSPRTDGSGGQRDALPPRADAVGLVRRVGFGLRSPRDATSSRVGPVAPTALSTRSRSAASVSRILIP